MLSATKKRLCVWMAALGCGTGALAFEDPPVPAESATQSSDSPTAVKEEQPTQPPATAATAPAVSPLRPRFQLQLHSAKEFIRRVRDSRGGWFVKQMGRMAMARAEENVDGPRPEDIAAVISQLEQWPDASLSAVVFAPDVRGRARWAVVAEWPIQDLHGRVVSLLELPAVKELVEGVRILPAESGGHRIAIGKETLCHLVPLGEGKSALASHTDLPLSIEPLGVPAVEGAGPPLLEARWNLTGTEADSGATFFSSFSAVTAVSYSGGVGENGNWSERLEVHWPPLSGMGIKAFFARVKQTFFVPHDAFGALAVNSGLLPGMLESMAGFGPQVIMEAPGEMSIVGEPEIGPIAAAIDSEICVSVLPGQGFLPAPDIVVQARVRRTDKLVDRLREATGKINEVYRQRDLAEPWQETTILDRPVFWSKGGGNYPGMLMPMVMRPVIFVSEERDAADKDRKFLVLAWTSTSPPNFAKRWLQLPRSTNRTYLPSEKKTDGQIWVNWDVVYRVVVPYVNVALGSVVAGAMLPTAGEAVEQLTESWITAGLSYSGLTFSHQGPIPLGAFLVPTMALTAAAPDESGGSDLARERLAVQRIEVLYHHAKLFKKDIGRWPAEIAELDGYVDFAGHPELLELELSSRKLWRDLFVGFFEPEEEEDDEDDLDEHVPEIDDSLFAVEWSREDWRLGLAPGTLDHLEKLYIDGNGVIHRIEKSVVPPNDDEDQENETKSKETAATASDTDVATLPNEDAGESEPRHPSP